jgi:uncharacterized membrane protein (DUF2068 family)
LRRFTSPRIHFSTRSPHRPDFSQLPFWKRAVFTNAIAAIGVYVGFASSGVKLPTILQSRIAVFTFAFLNFMFLVVAPRINARRNAGEAALNPWRVFYQVVSERPFITALLILQLPAVARATATTVVFMETSASEYVRTLPNAQSMSLRLMGASVLMAGVASLWLLATVGLWRSRPWAWWLALVLNGLAAMVSVALQLIKHNEFLLAPLAITAVVLLLLRPLRIQFRSGEAAVAGAD